MAWAIGTVTVVSTIIIFWLRIFSCRPISCVSFFLLTSSDENQGNLD